MPATQENLDIADTIKYQIDINRMIAMVDASHFVTLIKGFQFSFKGSKKMNLVKIHLNVDDLYNVSFYKKSGINCKIVSNHTDIYAGQLRELFATVTGLAVSL